MPIHRENLTPEQEQKARKSPKICPYCSSRDVEVEDRLGEVPHRVDLPNIMLVCQTCWNRWSVEYAPSEARGAVQVCDYCGVDFKDGEEMVITPTRGQAILLCHTACSKKEVK